MRPSENFLKQYEAYVASQWYARRMEFKFMAAVPAMFEAARIEMDMTPHQFGELLGVSGSVVCAIEDGVVTAGNGILQGLARALSEEYIPSD